MPAAHSLLLFVLAVLGLMVSPGPNMAMVLSHSVAQGPRGGVVVAGGILAADLVMTVLTARGIVALVAAWPPSFVVLRYAGAAYLVLLAVRAWQSRTSREERRDDARSLGDLFGRAMLVSLLNPKALLFFLLFLPPFVDSVRGNVGVQLLWLGLVMSVVAFTFHALLGAFGGQIGRWRATGRVPARGLLALQSAIFLVLAVRLLALDVPGRA